MNIVESLQTSLRKIYTKCLEKLLSWKTKLSILLIQWEVSKVLKKIKSKLTSDT